jgi:hypothetical protein
MKLLKAKKLAQIYNNHRIKKAGLAPAFLLWKTEE